MIGTVGEKIKRDDNVDILPSPPSKRSCQGLENINKIEAEEKEEQADLEKQKIIEAKQEAGEVVLPEYADEDQPAVQSSSSSDVVDELDQNIVVRALPPAIPRQTKDPTLTCRCKSCGIGQVSFSKI